MSAGAGSLSNVLYISIIVQGVAAPPDELEAHIEYVFSNTFPDRLSKLSDSEFQSYKAAFANSLQEVPLSVEDEFSHAWSPVSQGGNCFDLHDQMLKYLNESLSTKDPLVEAYNNMIFPATGTRKRVAVKYFGGTVTPRPTEEAMVANLEKAGVPTTAITMMRKEYGQTIVVDNANSTVRAQLQQHSQYYPTDKICRLKNSTSTSKAPVGRLRVQNEQVLLHVSADTDIVQKLHPPHLRRAGHRS